MQKVCIDSSSAGAVISLSKWLAEVGITPITAWRWRKRGWLKTVNIAGRQYLTQEAIDEFYRRADMGASILPRIARVMRFS